jgi:GNAT superfamily N-acetyltransferase
MPSRANFQIRASSPRDSAACDAIINSLPYHFGDFEGRDECARAVRSEDGIVVTADHAVAGFLTSKPWFATSREITWMAVHAAWRGRGIGSLLIDHLAQLATRERCRYLLVTTLSASIPEPGVEDGYARTRAFYERHGFSPTWEPHGWWSKDSQAVLMLRPLEPSRLAT